MNKPATNEDDFLHLLAADVVVKTNSFDELWSVGLGHGYVHLVEVLSRTNTKVRYKANLNFYFQAFNVFIEKDTYFTLDWDENLYYFSVARGI